MAYIAILLSWINSGLIMLRNTYLKSRFILYNPKQSSLQPCFQSITIQKPVCSIVPFQEQRYYSVFNAKKRSSPTGLSKKMSTMKFNTIYIGIRVKQNSTSSHYRIN